MTGNQYNAHSASLRSKVNRSAIASQRCKAEDRVQRAIVTAIAAVIGAALGALLLGASAIHVSWVTCALVLGLAIAFSWRARIVAKLEPEMRTLDAAPWKPTSKRPFTS